MPSGRMSKARSCNQWPCSSVSCRMIREINILWVGVTLLLSSCNSQFNREWAEAGKATDSSVGIEGRWEGKWHSDATGHTGRLSCIVGPAANADGDHPFHYRATWGPIFSGSFLASHRVVKSSGAITFHGTHKMPAWVGDSYTYDGTVRDGRFKAWYRSSSDHGTFDMNRLTSRKH